MSIREGRKSRVESLSKTGRTPSRPVEAMLHRHLHRVKASKLPRRRFLHLAAGAATLPVVSRDARGQAYPTRPITMIVPSAAGGATDVVARILAERMRRLLEKPVIIENVSGANGSIGAGRVARAAPDGYTIIIGIVTTHVLNGALYSLQYDVMNAFAPIALLASTPLILFARSTMQANNLNELLLWLKANSNNASMGFGGTGSYLLSALFQKEIATHLTLVPYRGGNLATQDLVAGQIDLQFNSLDQLPLARASKIKAYLVTSDTRLATAADIPTAAEMGLPALSYSQWTGLFAPRGTPEGVISKLNGAAADALADSAVQSGLSQLGMEIFPRDQQTPEALRAKQRADAAKWLPLIKEFGIKAE